MAAKKKTDEEIAFELLVAAMDVKNETYAPAIEHARLDAAEYLLKLTTPGEAELKDKALDFLRRAMNGKVPSLGAQQRARAAAIIIRNTRGTL